MDNSTPFTESVSFLTSAFKYILNYLDNIILFADVSILELNIAFTVFGLLFVALFTVVRAGSVYSFETSSELRAQKKADAIKKEKQIASDLKRQREERLKKSK